LIVLLNFEVEWGNKTAKEKLYNLNETLSYFIIVL